MFWPTGDMSAYFVPFLERRSVRIAISSVQEPNPQGKELWKLCMPVSEMLSPLVDGETFGGSGGA